MTKRNWTVTVLTALLAFVLFGGGVIVGQRLMIRALGIQVNSVQAMLLVNRIVQEGQLKSLLERGCVPEAIGAISNDELADRKMLSGFVHAKLDKDTIEYINRQDPNILGELDSSTGTYTNTWPGCKK